MITYFMYKRMPEEKVIGWQMKELVKTFLLTVFDAECYEVKGSRNSFKHF